MNERYSRTSYHGKPKRILVLGLGNDLLADDRIGLMAVASLQARHHELITDCEIEYLGCSEHGISLLEYFIGFDAAIIIDAIATGAQQPGTILQLKPNDFGGVIAPSPHYTGLPELIGIAHQLDLHFPEDIRIFACETEDTTTLGGQLTDAVEAALPELIDQVQQSLRSLVEVEENQELVAS